MNKSYVIIGDNIVISDEKGNQKVIKYDELVESILKQENVVELLEKQIKQYEDTLKEYEKVPSCFKLKHYLLPPLILAIFSTVIGIVFDIYGHYDFSAYCGLYYGLPEVYATFISVCFFIVDYSKYRTANKEKIDLNDKIEGLNLKLEKEQEKLRQLQEEWTLQAEQTHDLSSEPIHTQVISLIPQYPVHEKGHQLVKKYNKN